MKEPKERIYTIYEPVQEIWVMEVSATSGKEALRKLKQGYAHQIHSHAGTTKSGLSEIVSIRDHEEDA